MRKSSAVLAAISLLAACTGADTDQVSTSTTSNREVVTTTTTTTIPVTTSHAGPTTTEPVEEPDDGSESIGVTDEVTIVITDPDE